MRVVTVVHSAPSLADAPPLRVESMLRGVGSYAPMCAICSMCRQREACLPVGLVVDPAVGRSQNVGRRRRVARSAPLYRTGEHFGMFHAIRLGSFKTTLLLENGQEQVGGFYLPGEILGSDGVDTGLYGCEAVALEDSEVCSFSIDALEAHVDVQSGTGQIMQRVFGREIAREQRVMLMLGTMAAEQRLAAFLLDLSQRYAALGYSSREFVLRLTRAEIGSYLGLKLETISRMLSRFHRDGLIQVQGRVLKLLDLEALKKLLDRST